MDQNNIKHFILIRFYSVTILKDKTKLFNYDILHEGLECFKKYTLKSLENMDNKNFEVLFLIHNDLPADHRIIDEIANIETELDFTVIRNSAINEYISEAWNNYKYVITTRMNHDDMIYYYAVNDIQENINENLPFMYYGYNKGLTMEDEYINTARIYRNMYKDGHMSIFQSFVANTEYIQKPMSIFDLGVHSKVNIKIKEMAKQYKVKDIKSLYMSDDMDDAFIYMKHKYNSSLIMYPTKVWAATKETVDYEKEWYTGRFGLEFAE